MDVMPLFPSKVDRSFRTFCRTGDPEALGLVFDATAPHLMRVAMWLVRHRQDAEDLVQRTFLQAIQLRDRYETSRRALPWLTGLLSKQALKLRRENGRVLPQPVRTDDVRDPVVEAAASEFDEALRALHSRLAPQYRDVLELHFSSGLSAKEIAHQLQRPAGTVRTQLVRGLERLQRGLPKSVVPCVVATGMLRGEVVGVSAIRTRVMESARAEAAAIAVVPQAGASGLAVGSIALCVLAFCGWMFAVGIKDSEMGQSVALVSSEPGRHSPVSMEASVDVDAAGERIVRNTMTPPSCAVEVEVHWFASSRPAAQQIVSCRQSMHPLADWKGVTDAQGKVVFEGLEPGPAWFYGGCSGSVSVILKEGERAQLKLEWAPGIEFEGFVRNERGAVANALIMFRTSADSWSVPIARADDSGQFRLDIPRCGLLSVVAEGHSPSAELAIGAEGVEALRHEFILHRSKANLRVRVLDSKARPIVGATVFASPDPHDESHLMPRGPSRSACTDEQGLVVWNGMRDGSHDVLAWARGFGARMIRVELGRESPQTIEVRLDSGAVIEGTVRDKAGRPLHQVAIRPDCYLGPWSLGTKSDEHGRFYLPDLPAGMLPVIARIAESGTARRSLQLHAGSTTAWDPVLDLGRFLGGRVVDPSGRGLALRVQGTWPGLPAALPGQDGRFRIFDVPEGPQALEVTNIGQVLARFEGLVAPRDDLVLEVLDPLESSVRGRVLDEIGRPLRCSVLVGSRRLATNTSGVFFVEGFAAGRFDVQLDLEDGRREYWCEVELGRGQSLDLGDWQPGELEVAIRAVDSGGHAAAGNMRLCAANGQIVRQAVLTGGGVVFRGLRPGHYIVRCSATRAEGEIQIDLPLRGEVPVVRLEPRVLYRIRCVGGTTAKAEIEIRSVSGFYRRIKAPVSDNAYEGETCLLPLGQVTLRAKTADGRLGELEVVVVNPSGSETVPRIIVPLLPSGR